MESLKEIKKAAQLSLWLAAVGNTLQHHGSQKGPDGTTGRGFFREGRRLTFSAALLSIRISRGLWVVLEPLEFMLLNVT